MNQARVWVVVDGHGEPLLDALGQVWAGPTKKSITPLCYDDLRPALYVPVFVPAPTPRKRRKR